MALLVNPSMKQFTQYCSRDNKGPAIKDGSASASSKSKAKGKDKDKTKATKPEDWRVVHLAVSDGIFFLQDVGTAESKGDKKVVTRMPMPMDVEPMCLSILSHHSSSFNSISRFSHFCLIKWEPAVQS